MPVNRRSHRLLTATIGTILAAGCAVPPPGAVSKADRKADRATPAPSAQASPAAASPAIAASPAARAAYFGRVLGLDGKPAAGIPVRGFLVANNGAGIVANNGGGLVTDNGAGLVASNGSAYALAQTPSPAPLATTTGPDGTFELASPDGAPLNIEAEADPQTKAIRLDVPPDARGFDLQLAPTGSIAGRITAEGATNLAGVDVYVPGTSYLAKTDEAGSFTIANVPVGTFRLLASKLGLGEGAATGVAVASRQATQVPPIALVLKRPAVTALDRTGGAPGTPVVITGENFAAAAAAPFEVTFGGAVASGAVRTGDGRIEVAVPEGGKSGEVVVAVNGVAGPGRPFTVYKSLATTMGLRDLGLGQVQVWTPAVLDDQDRPVVAPEVAWAVEGTAIAVAPDGTLTAQAAGQATLRATSGSLAGAPVTVKVHDAPAVVATLAGGKEAGFVDGLGLAARFEMPRAIGVTSGGDLLVLDHASLRAVRVRGPGQGRVTTVAGDGTAGDTDGEGRNAQLLAPRAVLRDDKVYLLDSDGNDRSLIKLATPLAGGAWQVRAIAGGATGYAEGTGPAARFRWPDALAVTASGTLYVADKNHRIRRLVPAADGAYVASTLVGNGAAGKADGQGEAAGLGYTCQLALAGETHLWVADASNRLVRRVDLATGTLATIAGSGDAASADGAGATAAFKQLTDIMCDAAGNAYVHDYPARIAKVTPAGAVTTLAPAARKLLGVDAQGRVYGQTDDFRLVRWDAAGQATVLAGNGNLEAIDGPGTTAALQDALGFAIDADGLLYLSEYSDYGGDHRLRRIWVRP